MRNKTIIGITNSSARLGSSEKIGTCQLREICPGPKRPTPVPTANLENADSRQSGKIPENGSKVLGQIGKMVPVEKFQSKIRKFEVKILVEH